MYDIPKLLTPICFLVLPSARPMHHVETPYYEEYHGYDNIRLTWIVCVPVDFFCLKRKNTTAERSQFVSTYYQVHRKWSQRVACLPEPMHQTVRCCSYHRCVLVRHLGGGCYSAYTFTRSIAGNALSIQSFDAFVLILAR